MRIETTMTNQHPITPPQELVDQWSHEWYHSKISDTVDLDNHIATQAAQWGADQELEACLLWAGDGRRENLSQVIALQRIRRPKPLSLKEQALAAQQRMWDGTSNHDDWNLIRRALEALDD